MKDSLRYTLLGAVLLLVAGSIYLLSDSQTGVSKLAEIKPTTGSSVKDIMYPHAKEITKPSGFVNTAGSPVKISDYIGKKVILVDFLTYSCINCVRAQPYLNAWNEKYAGQGLQIIGIHTPEFDFEKDIKNVEPAMRDMGVKYPIVLDNDYGTWSAYQNSYWPREYLIDIDGYIVHDHIGEGGYDDTEREIQKLLLERAERLGERAVASKGLVTPVHADSIADGMPRSPETYFGSSRNSMYLENGKSGVDGLQKFVSPKSLNVDRLYLDGSWTIKPEYAEAGKGAGIRMLVHAKKIFLVAGSAKESKLTVRMDGKLMTSGDVFDGNLFVHDQRLYTLAEFPEWGEHTLEITVEEEGAPQVFTFTFG